jgi:S-DNA-T family DNA segregation ATPase FtsK/SpoIIIE
MSIQNQMNSVLNELGIAGSCVKAKAHRHLAYFDIELERNLSALPKLQRSTRQISLAIKSKTVPIIDIVSNEGIVRLQVALTDAKPIPLMNLLYDEMIPGPTEMVFPMMLGESERGTKFWMDMNKNPHLLIAGSTGSGKSTLLHTLIANGLMLHAMRARNVHIYLNDPKCIEFQEYSSPELKSVIKDIASKYSETLSQLEHLVVLMDHRYEKMSQLNMRSIEEDPLKMALVLCIVDEVADLMIQDKASKLQNLIVKLAQKGRAAGIFMVLATQRPSVNVLTGLIKANFPGRIACKTSSKVDSMVILDRVGAETLLGRGDAVLKNQQFESLRFQVAQTTPAININLFISFGEYAQKTIAKYG